AARPRSAPGEPGPPAAARLPAPPSLPSRSRWDALPFPRPLRAAMMGTDGRAGGGLRRAFGPGGRRRGAPLGPPPRAVPPGGPRRGGVGSGGAGPRAGPPRSSPQVEGRVQPVVSSAHGRGAAVMERGRSAVDRLARALAIAPATNDDPRVGEGAERLRVDL